MNTLDTENSFSAIKLFSSTLKQLEQIIKPTAPTFCRGHYTSSICFCRILGLQILKKAQAHQIYFNLYSKAEHFLDFETQLLQLLFTWFSIYSSPYTESLFYLSQNPLQFFCFCSIDNLLELYQQGHIWLINAHVGSQHVTCSCTFRSTSLLLQSWSVRFLAPKSSWMIFLMLSEK